MIRNVGNINSSYTWACVRSFYSNYSKPYLSVYMSDMAPITQAFLALNSYK